MIRKETTQLAVRCLLLHFDRNMCNSRLNMVSGFNMHLISTSQPELLGLAIAITSICIVSAYYCYIRRKPKGCLDSKIFREFKLANKTQLSHNVALFRFALSTPTSVLGLPVGSHVICRGKDREGRPVTRPYTPVTLDSDTGYFELVVKMYPAGRMSHHFREMREGDYLAVKASKQRLKYQPGQFRAFGMIAGGSGITPMFQLIRAILENPKDRTIVQLIYANTTFQDILLKDKLDDFASTFPKRFKVYYILTQPPETWNGGVGHISREMIQDHCPAPASDIQILRCGPPGMNKAVAAHLAALGYTPSMQFEF